MATRSKPRPVRRPSARRRPTTRTRDVSRAEFATVLDQLREHTHDLAIQFRRIADIQADLDEIKRAWHKIEKRSARGQ